MPDIPIEVPFAQALLCPTCAKTGKVLHSNPILGGTVHLVQCGNELCPWYQTNWVIETDTDGKVKVNEDAYKKANATRLSPKLDPDFDRKHEEVLAVLDRQIAEETSRE